VPSYARFLAVKNCGEGLTVEHAPYLSGDRQSVVPKKASIPGLTLETDRLQILSAISLGMHQPMLDVIGLCEII
jgi:hypothetical protein